MNISLPSDLKSYVEKKVKSGLNEDESSVIRDALYCLQERDRLLAYKAGVPSSSLGSPSAVGPLNFDTGNSDIEDIVMIVMMEAAKSNDEDLKEILEEMKARNAARRSLRELIAKVRKDVAANSGKKEKGTALDLASGLGGQSAYHRARLPVLDPQSSGGVKFVPTDLWQGKIEDISQLTAIQDDLKDQLDSISEMSEMDMLRLQMMMDRRSKFISTLSNIMKKMSDTAAAITSNLK